MMKRKLRILFTQTPKKNRRNLPFCIAMLAICLSTLSGCASQKAPAPDVSAQSETDHTPAAGQDLPFSGTQAAKNSTTISLYLESDSGTTALTANNWLLTMPSGSTYRVTVPKS